HHYRFDTLINDTVADSAGSLHGTSANGPELVPGKKGNGLAFDSDDDLVDLPNTVLDGLDDVTVALWIKTTDTGPQALVAGAKSANPNEFLMYFTSHTWFEFHGGGTSKFWSGLPSIADGEWHHVAVVRNATDDEVTF